MQFIKSERRSESETKKSDGQWEQAVNVDVISSHKHRPDYNILSPLLKYSQMSSRTEKLFIMIVAHES